MAGGVRGVHMRHSAMRWKTQEEEKKLSRSSIHAGMDRGCIEGFEVHLFLSLRKTNKRCNHQPT